MARTFLNNIVCALAAAHVATAFPGLKNLMVELGTRQAPPEPNVPIGDLATEGPTTPVGHRVMDCLDDKGCQSNAVCSSSVLWSLHSYANIDGVDIQSAW